MDFVDHIWYSCIRGDDMIIDITGVQLTPGNNGEDCKGNGKHLDEKGILIECCCDECDYFLLCKCHFSLLNLHPCMVFVIPRSMSCISFLHLLYIPHTTAPR